MNIVICGSSTFCKEMVEIRDKLNDMGHQGIINHYYEELAAGRMPELMERINREHAQVKKEYGFMHWYYDAIRNSDGVLILNYDKNGVSNCIGGNTFLEMGCAHMHHKKIFLLNPIPKMSYTEELEAMDPIILNGDLSKIK
ncbi:MAG: hypothetical protein HZB67_02535 [Candidatus Aenigmarchaeota archaeon]|nr:hypothetical protein [Candidatus Aenigmarchaeota archaeon]